jgi:hypothetical protein
MLVSEQVRELIEMIRDNAENDGFICVIEREGGAWDIRLDAVGIG